MKVIKMVSYEGAQKYPDCCDQDIYNDFWEFVKKYIVENNIKMCGHQHQFFGVPLIEHNGKIYAFALSCRWWGQLMAEAYEPENKDKYAYCNWAWEIPDGEEAWTNPDYKIDDEDFENDKNYEDEN